MDSHPFPSETINTSFTKSKTNVIDYLLEWAGNHNWRIYLINMLIEKNEGLSPEERELTYNYFLKTLSLYEEELHVLKKI